MTETQPPDFTLQVAQTREQVESLRDDWRDLDRQTSRPSVFMTWEWMEAWLHSVDWRRRLHVVVLRDPQGKIAVIAPLMIGTNSALDRGERVVSFLGSDGPAGGTYLDLLARPDWEGRAQHAVLDHLAEQKREFRYINLSRVAMDEPGFIHWMTAALDHGLHATVDLRNRTVWSPLPGTYADYIAAVTNKRWRQRMRNFPAALKRDFPSAQFIDRGRHQPLDGVLADLKRLQEMRWDNEGGSYYKRPGFDRYIARVCANMQEQGRLRAVSLMIDGGAVSSRVALVHRGTWLDFHTGWDPAFAKNEVSHLTLWHCAELAIQEGLTRMDSLNEYDYKRRYFRETRWVADVRLFDERLGSAGREIWKAGRRAARRTLRDLAPDRLRAWIRGRY